MTATFKFTLQASEQLSLTEFLSCKDYLAQLYKTSQTLIKDFNKSPQAGKSRLKYSYLVFAEDLGFGHTNVLRLVLIGERPFSVKAAEKVASALKMTGFAKKYWLQLATYEQAKDASERDAAFADLMKTRTQKLAKKLDKKLIGYFSAWFNPVIRELIECQSKPVSAEEIQNRLSFPLRLDEIKKSLQLLSDLGFIKQTASETYLGTGVQISTGREVDHIDIVLYHQKMMEMAKESMTRIEEHRRDIQAATIGIPKHYVPILKERIQQWVAEAMAIDRITKENDEVYQLNIQLFPFTKEG